MASPLSICASCLRATTNTARTTASRQPRAFSHAVNAYSKPTIAAIRPLSYVASVTKRTIRERPRASVVPKIARPRASAHYVSRRTLATTSDPSAPQQAQAVLNPRTDDDGKPMLISISPRASNRLYAISSGDKNPNLALRVTIESGGCHGFQYLMDLTDLGKTPATDEDTIFQGAKGEKVVIDEPSLELLSGSTVDYTMELIGSQFKITGIPGATSSCGCGSSFDIQL